MEIKGIRIRHKAFGEGVIKEQRGHYIIVTFGDEDKQFTFPEAYGAYFTAVEPADDATVLHCISALQAKKDALSNAERKREFMRRMQERQHHKD